MQRRQVLFFGGILACGAASYAEARQVEIPPSQPVMAATAVSLDEMHDAIVRGGRERNWIVSEDVPGKVSLRLNLRTHSVIVAVRYTQTNFRIEYVWSQNLDFEERSGKRYIHGNYVRWVRNLEQSIQRALPIRGGAPR